MADWTHDIEEVLDCIRKNCHLLQKEHKKGYFRLNYQLKYFRLPTIILGAFVAVLSNGFTSYIPQQNISLITSALGLTCSIVGSVELYLGIQKRMEIAHTTSTDFYLLSVEIFKTLALLPEHRPIPAKEYLEKKYEEYCQLIEKSNLLDKKVVDHLSGLEIITESRNAIMNFRYLPMTSSKLVYYEEKNKHQHDEENKLSESEVEQNQKGEENSD